MTLTEERCAVCQTGSPLVTPDEEPELRAQVPGWDVIEIDGVRRLQRVFPIKGWRAPLDFSIALGELAAEEDHHPAILIEWGKVTVSWWTHAIRGLHRNDFVMAAKTDALAQTS